MNNNFAFTFLFARTSRRLIRLKDGSDLPGLYCRSEATVSNTGVVPPIRAYLTQFPVLEACPHILHYFVTNVVIYKQFILAQQIGANYCVGLIGCKPQLFNNMCILLRHSHECVTTPAQSEAFYQTTKTENSDH